MSKAVIYGTNQKGESWIEHVCASDQEGKALVEYLNNRSEIAPSIDDDFWQSLGLTYRQKDIFLQLLEEFKSIDKEAKPFFYFKKEDNNTEPQQLTVLTERMRRVQILSVSQKNKNNNYVVSFILVDDNSVNNIHAGRVYKITVEQPTITVGSFHNFDFSEFTIIKRPAGYEYVDFQNEKMINRKVKRET
mgnify:CR=1 FL=1